MLPLQKQVSFDTNLACGISVGTEFRLVRNSYTISIGTEFIYDLDEMSLKCSSVFYACRYFMNYFSSELVMKYFTIIRTWNIS